MTQKNQRLISPDTARHPLLLSLSRLAEEAIGMSLVVTYVQADEGVRIGAGAPALHRQFCRLVQSSPEGAKRCRTCHVLMSVAACSGAPIEHHCHAGACVLVAPASASGRETLAVLSSCLYGRNVSRAETSARAVAMGIAPAAMREAYCCLPKLAPKQLELAAMVVKAAAEAVKTLHGSAKPAPASDLRSAGAAIRLALGKNLGQVPPFDRTRAGKPHAQRGQASLLVEVVEKLIGQRPDLPLTVKELADAARLTPNHFSALFHRYTGKPFSDYLADARITAAKGLLRDLTLNIGEVGSRVGYHAPGYFARQFRRKTRMTPRAWRDSHLSA